MTDEIINFYTLDAMKKYIPHINDEQEKLTGMKLFKHFLVCGGTGAGKSNMFMNYLQRTSEGKGTYKHIYVCYKTEGEPFYQFLKKSLSKDEISFFKTVGEFPNIEDFSDQIDDPGEKPIKGKKKVKKEPDKFLVIFDDCVNDKDHKALNKIEKYFTYARKKYITLCFLSQSFFDTSCFIRKQVSYVILCSIRGLRDLNLICKDYSFDMDSKQIIELYEKAMEKTSEHDLPFFKINTMHCDINKKFSRNFLDYFEIKKVEKKGEGCSSSKMQEEPAYVRQAERQIRRRRLIRELGNNQVLPQADAIIIEQPIADAIVLRIPQRT